jgi:hypothetical protein
MASLSLTAAAGEFSAKGAGVRGCGDFIQDVEYKYASDLGLANQWVMGFVAGASHRTPGNRTGVDIDAAAAQAWLEKYCREHPADDLTNAAVNLVKELEVRKFGRAYE